MSESYSANISRLINLLRDNFIKMDTYEVLNIKTGKMEKRLLITLKGLSEDDYNYLKYIIEK